MEIMPGSLESIEKDIQLLKQSEVESLLLKRKLDALALRLGLPESLLRQPSGSARHED